MNDHAAALVLMVGPPGSGKSTWIAGRFPVHDVFSLDVFRRMLTGDVADQGAAATAATMLHTAVDYRMSRRLTTVVDACSTRRAYREPLIDSARRYGVPVLAVVMSTPLDVCLTRNASRDITPAPAAPYPGANAAPVPPNIVTVYAYETRKEPPRVGEVDAVLTVGADGRAVEWDAADWLPIEVLAEPWLADTLEAPSVPQFAPDPR